LLYKSDMGAGFERKYVGRITDDGRVFLIQIESKDTVVRTVLVGEFDEQKWTGSGQYFSVDLRQNAVISSGVWAIADEELQFHLKKKVEPVSDDDFESALNGEIDTRE